MKIEVLVLGELYTNVYILKKDGYSLIIDPADDYKTILESVKDTKLLGMIVTHEHDDHILARNDLISSGVTELEYKENMEVGPFKFKVINNPGHTNDSKTFYFEKEKIMFVGDFIFKNSIGRTDLDSGNHDEMMKSLKMIETYPNCKLFPGHGESTTLDYEKKNNIFFKMI